MSIDRAQAFHKIHLEIDEYDDDAGLQMALLVCQKHAQYIRNY